MTAKILCTGKKLLKEKTNNVGDGMAPFVSALVFLSFFPSLPGVLFVPLIPFCCFNAELGDTID